MKPGTEPWKDAACRAVKLKEMGWGIKDIAVAIGRSYEATKQKLLHAKANGLVSKRRMWSIEEVARMVAMRDAGASYREIGEAFGIGKQAAYEIFVRRGKHKSRTRSDRQKSVQFGDHGQYIQKLPQIPDHIARKFARDEPLTDAEIAEYNAAIAAVGERYREMVAAGEIIQRRQR
jgi:hypothetical protein